MQGVIESGNNRERERAIKELDSCKKTTKKTMAIDIAFQFLKILVDREGGRQMRLPQAISAGEENFSIELTLTCVNFIIKVM